jgi:hypothetical protein
MDIGSTTPNTAAVAIAASTALPPSINTLTPAKVANGWLETTMPFLAMTLDRFVILLAIDVEYYAALDSAMRIIAVASALR